MKTLITFIVAASCALPLNAVVTNITSGGALHATIQAAVNAAASGDTLLVSTGLYNERVYISQKSLNLYGGYWADFITRTNLTAATCINAGAAGPALYVVSNCTVTLERLMLTNGVNFIGGGILMDIGVTVTANLCAVGYNSAMGGGGIALGTNSLLVLVNTPVYYNHANGGGGIYAFNATTRVELRGPSTDIRDNSAGYGGGIFANGGEVHVLENADVYRNVAVERGGGMYLGNGARGVVSGNGIIIGTTAPNRATNSVAEGGGVYVQNASLVVDNYARFYANHATVRGGGIYVTNGSVTVRNHAVIGYHSGTVSNYAALGGGIFAVDSAVMMENNAGVMHGHAGYGGGIFLWNSSGVFTQVQIAHNAAASVGGGMYVYLTSAVWMASCVVESNRAVQAGGMLCQVVPSEIVISNTLFARNGSSSFIGALEMDLCPAALICGGSRLEENSAQLIGGAYFNACQALRIQDVVVCSNLAAQYAGVVMGSSPGYDLQDCDFVDNVATGGSYGALTVFDCSGRVRTHARPAMMTGNYAHDGGAMAVYSRGAVEISAPEYPLVIVSNSAAGVGGGVWVMDYSTVTVAGVVQFVSNTAWLGGAIMVTNRAVVALLPTNGVAPVFIANAAANDGGAINLMATSRVHAVNCTFHGNHAGAFGGAIRNRHSYLQIEPDFTQAGGTVPSVLAGNSALWGGAIHSVAAPLTLVDSALIVSNTGSNIGGGVRMMSGSAAHLKNCVLAHNTSANGGGAAIDTTSSAQLRHCTIIENTADGVVSAGGAIALTNCIVRGNTPGQITAGYTVNSSDVEGSYPGGGNIDADPLFKNAAEFDYALSYGSPCVNAGIAAGITWDCIGTPRPMGGGYDMGAYEQNSSPVQVVFPALLDFGDVAIGDSAALPVSIMNTGNSGLTGTVNFVPVPVFTVDPMSYSAAPLETTNVMVTFSPPVEYHWTQTIVFASNGGNADVVLIGTGIPEPHLLFLIGLIGVIGPIRRVISYT